MIPSGNMPRRLFLHMLVSLHIYAFVRPAYIYDQENVLNSFDSLSSKLAGFFMHKESAKKIGLEYLKISPLEADIALLTDLICSFNEKYRVKLLNADSRSFKELLRHGLCLDFEQDRVVNVHGWILAVTEARLCALTALL